MSPLEALEHALGMTVLQHRGRYEKPGDIIKRMGPEHREALSRLTSEDTLKLRMDVFWDYNHEARCRLSSMLMEFDQKLIS